MLKFFNYSLIQFQIRSSLPFGFNKPEKNWNLTKTTRKLLNEGLSY
jgi:hypothetical protein